MPSVACEVCGDADLLKEGGVFKCQGCGTKYTVEEMKNMAAAGSAPAGAAAPVGPSDQAEKLLANARGIYDDGDCATAESLFTQVLNLAPDNYIAIFYRGMSGGWQSSVAKNRVPDAAIAAERALRVCHGEHGDSRQFVEFYAEVHVAFMNLCTAGTQMFIDYANKMIAELKRESDSYGFANPYAPYDRLRRDMEDVQSTLNSGVASIHRAMNRVISTFVTLLDDAGCVPRDVAEPITEFFEALETMSQDGSAASESRKIRSLWEAKLIQARVKRRERYLAEHPEMQARVDELHGLLTALQAEVKTLEAELGPLEESIQTDKARIDQVNKLIEFERRRIFGKAKAAESIQAYEAEIRSIESRLTETEAAAGRQREELAGKRQLVTTYTSEKDAILRAADEAVAG